MTSISLANRFPGLETILGPDALLIEGFTGHEGVSRPFRFELDLLAQRDDASKVDPSRLIGSSATLSMRLEDESLRYINGVVRRFTTGATDSTFVSYTAE